MPIVNTSIKSSLSIYNPIIEIVSIPYPVRVFSKNPTIRSSFRISSSSPFYGMILITILYWSTIIILSHSQIFCQPILLAYFYYFIIISINILYWHLNTRICSIYCLRALYSISSNMINFPHNNCSSTFGYIFFICYSRILFLTNTKA